ncbi:MAG: hypothetical protein K0R38_2216 [Polyangiaceae bacterium]|nr:hypothetical protein [Polyangiaceae bacterium]
MASPKVRNHSGPEELGFASTAMPLATSRKPRRRSTPRVRGRFLMPIRSAMAPGAASCDKPSAKLK